MEGKKWEDDKRIYDKEKYLIFNKWGNKKSWKLYFPRVKKKEEKMAEVAISLDISRVQRIEIWKSKVIEMQHKYDIHCITGLPLITKIQLFEGGGVYPFLLNYHKLLFFNV